MSIPPVRSHATSTPQEESYHLQKAAVDRVIEAFRKTWQEPENAQILERILMRFVILQAQPRSKL